MPKLILFRGKPGVGKTTISNRVATELNMSVLRKDDIYDAVSVHIEEHAIRNQICEATIRNIIKSNLENHTSLILDGSYHYAAHIAQFRNWLLLHNLELVSILVICSDEAIWKKRFNKRQLNPKPNNIITDFEKLKKHYKSLETKLLEGELIIYSANYLEENIEIALKRIKQELKFG